jgi:hypothetical protein
MVESLAIPRDIVSNGTPLLRHLITQYWSRSAKVPSVALLVRGS